MEEAAASFKLTDARPEIAINPVVAFSFRKFPSIIVGEEGIAIKWGTDRLINPNCPFDAVYPIHSAQSRPLK